MGSRNSKRLSILGAPSLLKYAAEGMLPLELLHWYRLSHPDDAALGFVKQVFRLAHKRGGGRWRIMREERREEM